MALKYFTDISLEQNELLEASLQKVTQDPLGFVGQIIYNTSERTFKYYNGLAWKEITGDYPTLAAFNQEVQDRINGDAALQAEVDTLNGTTAQLVADLAQEIQNRITEDAALQSQINSTNDDLDTEIQNRIDGDANLQTQVTANAQAISTETTNRIANDNILQVNIDAEEAARIAADNTLQTNINSEASTRAVADTTLQSNIDAEESARISADAVLQAGIDAEGLTRQTADADLQSQINSNDTDISNLQSSKQDISEKGQANGYTPLDSGAKIDEAYLPDSILGQVSYQGTWDASTNTPTLVSPPDASTKGEYYVVSAGGAQFGITFETGDWIISKGDSWQKVDNTDAVTSVFGRLGNVVANESDYSGFYPLIADLDAEEAARIAGDSNLQTQIDNLPSPNDGTLTVNGTGALNGSGTFTANQSTNSTIDISHDSVGRVDIVDSLSPTFGGSFDVISSITSSAEGHVTATKLDTITLPTPNNATITLSAGTGISGGGFFTTDQSTDDTIVFSHADTSTQASVDNTGGNVIQDVTLDDFGHVTGLASVDLDSRYIQSETDTLQSVTDRGATTTNDITANAFIGDGSQLTNLPSSAASLQAVTDVGNTTTNSIGIGGNANYNEILTVNSTTKASTPVPRMSNAEVNAFRSSYTPQSGQMIYNYEYDRLLIGTYVNAMSPVPKQNDNKNIFRSVATTPINTYSSFTLSWYSVTYWNITLQDNTVFVETSYPPFASGQQMQIIMTGNYTPTFPSDWQLSPSSDSYDGTQRNLITAIYHGYDNNTGTHLIYYTIENMDTASGGGSSVNEKFEFTINTELFYTGNVQFFFGNIVPVGVTAVTINWGDGTTTTTAGGYVSHNYPSPGVYNISVEGGFYEEFGSPSSGGSMIANISNWGKFHLVSFCFNYCLNMTITATDSPVFDVAVNNGTVAHAFEGCALINPDVSSWDVSGINSFDFMFYNCSSMNQSFDTWDVTSALGFYEFIAATATSIGNYSKTLISWAQQDVSSANTNPPVYLTGGPQYAYVAENARITLVNQYGWQIFDGGGMPFLF